MNSSTLFGASLLLLVLCAPSTRAQTSWGPHPTVVAPPARAFHVLVHDPARGRTLLFGGQDASGPTPLNDTWEWDGTSWLELLPAHSPPPRWGAMACYDESRSTVVLFGGQQAGYTELGDTWEWNGSDWISLPVAGPSARAFSGLAFDTVQSAPVLFGGGTASNPVRDMWRLSNGVWQAMPLSTLPPASSGFVFCSDPVRRTILFQGGYTHQGAVLGECWIWDGNAWTRNSATRGNFAGSSAAFDPIRHRVVAFGGRTVAGPNGCNETWEWDGTSWLQRAPALSPTARSYSAMAFDSVQGRVVLFGGNLGASSNSNDTWDYSHFTPASYTNYGFGCPGTNGLSPRLDAVDGGLPWISEDWLLRISDIPVGPANVTFGLVGHSRATAYGLQLPYDLGVVGMPGCLLQMSGDESTTLLPNLGGHADWLIHFPPDVRLVGTNWFMQAAVLDARANALGLTVSNGGHASPGMK